MGNNPGYWPEKSQAFTQFKIILDNLLNIYQSDPNKNLPLLGTRGWGWAELKPLSK